MAERGVGVDHVTLYRWVQRFTPPLVEAARPRRHAAGDRWFVDETYVKVAEVWRYVYRTIDQSGQVIDVFVSTKGDTAAAPRFFRSAIAGQGEPVEVTTDRSPVLAKTIRELVPGAHHDTTQYANNRIENDHGRLMASLRPMRWLQRGCYWVDRGCWRFVRSRRSLWRRARRWSARFGRWASPVGGRSQTRWFSCHWRGRVGVGPASGGARV